MIAAVIMCFTAFGAGILTLFSGFGLGTILMPVVALFFPVETAIALTAVVHFINNLGKLFLVGRFAKARIVIWFGAPAFAASFAGAWALEWLSHLTSLLRYEMAGHEFEVMPVKLTIAVLLIVFVLLEWRTSEQTLHVNTPRLPVGGLLSGFFGGLSGHQGAFRAAYLVNCGLTKQEFLGTSVVIACLVDVSRLAVYSTLFFVGRVEEHPVLLLTVIVSSLAGTGLAAWHLDKVTMKGLQTLVSAMLIGIAVGLGTGLI